ncbi:uncharacterized protein LOC128882382 [Hylaeus volcanicus]|uniref:uncharacterized protein LOC128882382 n=1 Tax=Hylaeus volcanicus TaxID=313075 RepID=UPI0023B7E62C|nr:uncharacterized protein LOC128882382 [Hylaeus volcanicus]
MCRNKVSICRRCGEERHGECNKQPHCTNCAGAHPSMSKECLTFQKEANIKKVMAYRNWPYNTAKTYIEGKLRNENMELIRKESKQGRWNFPPLQSKLKIEYWEDKEVPGLTFNVNKWNEPQEKSRNQGYIDLENEEQESMNRNRDIMDRKKEEKEKNKKQHLDYNEEYKGPYNNKYGRLLQHEVDRVPKEEVVYEYGSLYHGEKDIKKQSYIERKNNRKIIQQLEERNEEELLNDLVSLIWEKNLQGKVETIFSKTKYMAKWRPPPEDERWDVRNQENFETYVSEEERSRIRKRSEARKLQREGLEYLEAPRTSKPIIKSGQLYKNKQNCPPPKESSKRAIFKGASSQSKRRES